MNILSDHNIPNSLRINSKCRYLVEVNEISEFNIGQFSTGELVTTKLGVNANGSGGSVSINMEADINGDELSLQEINVLALVGRIL